MTAMNVAAADERASGQFTDAFFGGPLPEADGGEVHLLRRMLPRVGHGARGARAHGQRASMTARM
jgi:hypothetical protein